MKLGMYLNHVPAQYIHIKNQAAVGACMSQPPHPHEVLFFPISPTNYCCFFYRQAEDSELLRYDVMDAIGDCCRLMGAARCLEHYVKSLEKEIDGFIHSEPIIQVS